MIALSAVAAWVAVTGWVWGQVTPSAGTHEIVQAISPSAAPPTLPDPAWLADYNLVWIPPGTFVMGCLDRFDEVNADKYSRTTVVLTRGFYMGKYEVTQGEYLALTGHNPSFFRANRNLPIERVSWVDATNYCRLRTERERAEGHLPQGWRFRLPTNAEWEYACRAGTNTLFHYGDTLRSEMANFDGRFEYDGRTGSVTNLQGIFLGRTLPVGSFQPNAWGLYDLHGNVGEWVLDRFEGLPGGMVTNPVWTATELRNQRGHGWNADGRQLRCYLAGDARSNSQCIYRGFRVILSHDADATIPSSSPQAQP